MTITLLSLYLVNFMFHTKLDAAGHILRLHDKMMFHFHKVLVRLYRSSQHFLRMSPGTVAQSSSDGVTIRYVLPVLWMTPRFVTMGPMGVYFVGRIGPIH